MRRESPRQGRLQHRTPAASSHPSARPERLPRAPHASLRPASRLEAGESDEYFAQRKGVTVDQYRSEKEIRKHLSTLEELRWQRERDRLNHPDRLIARSDPVTAYLAHLNGPTRMKLLDFLGRRPSANGISASAGKAGSPQPAGEQKGDAAQPDALELAKTRVRLAALESRIERVEAAVSGLRKAWDSVWRFRHDVFKDGDRALDHSITAPADPNERKIADLTVRIKKSAARLRATQLDSEKGLNAAFPESLEDLRKLCNRMLEAAKYGPHSHPLVLIQAANLMSEASKAVEGLIRDLKGQSLHLRRFIEDATRNAPAASALPAAFTLPEGCPRQRYKSLKAQLSQMHDAIAALVRSFEVEGHLPAPASKMWAAHLWEVRRIEIGNELEAMLQAPLPPWKRAFFESALAELTQLLEKWEAAVDLQAGEQPGLIRRVVSWRTRMFIEPHLRSSIGKLLEEMCCQLGGSLLPPDLRERLNRLEGVLLSASMERWSEPLQRLQARQRRTPQQEKILELLKSANDAASGFYRRMEWLLNREGGVL